MQEKIAALLGLILIVTLGGCQLVDSPATPATSPLPTATPPRQQEVTPTATEIGRAVSTPVSFSGLTTLTLWVPDFLNPYEEEGNAVLLLEAIEAFSQAHRDIQVQVLVKKAEGPGGLYDLLHTGSQAAPSVLPDLMLLRTSDLRQAAGNEYVHPLPSTTVRPTGTFPIAGEATEILTATYGVPFFMDYQQTVYNPRLAVTPPLSWTAVLSGGYSLLFPAAPEEDMASDALLIAYLGTGATLHHEEDEPLLERAYVEQVFQFFKNLLDANQLRPEHVGALTNAAASWEAYQQGQGTLAVVPAGLYWTSPAQTGTPGWFPSPDGAPFTLGQLWSLTLVTQEPARKEAALALIEWLAAPERVAALSQQVGMLPTNQEALALWPLLPEDLAFVVALSEAAQLPPAPEDERLARRALQAGLEMLLENAEATPEQAASHALTVLRK